MTSGILPCSEDQNVCPILKVEQINKSLNIELIFQKGETMQRYPRNKFANAVAYILSLEPTDPPQDQGNRIRYHSASAQTALNGLKSLFWIFFSVLVALVLGKGF